MIKDIYKKDIEHISTIKEEDINENLIGETIVKRSCKPFKSGSKLAIVKGLSTHEVTGKPSFVLEDESVIEANMCKIFKED